MKTSSIDTNILESLKRMPDFRLTTKVNTAKQSKGMIKNYILKITTCRGLNLHQQKLVSTHMIREINTKKYTNVRMN